MAKQSKVDREIDKRVEQAYYKTCSGVQINMMNIPKVFDFGRKKVLEDRLDDEALGLSIRAYVDVLNRM